MPIIDDSIKGNRQDLKKPPLTKTEQYLIAVWKELLDTDDVNIDDDFFELGGHSLLAIQLRSRVKRDLGASVAHGVILRNTILADLASRIDEAIVYDGTTII